MVAGVPELLLRGGGLVDPGLAVDAVLEPAVGAADGDVEDEVEVLVEGGGVAAGLAPRIDDAGAVGVGEGEVPLLPERLVEVGVEDLQEAGVDVGEDVLFAPLDAEGVRGGGEGGVQGVALHVGAPPRVVVGVRAPVQRTRHDVVAALGVGVVVPARLADVDLARFGPWAVDAVDGQHPDGGPEPVTLGQRGGDLNASVLDRSTLLGVDSSRLDRVDNGPVGHVGHGDTVLEELGCTDALL